VGGEEHQRTLDERGDGVGALVAVQLAVDQARVVIKDRVAVLPADLGLHLGAGRRAIAGHLVPGPSGPPRAPAAAPATCRAAEDSG
jgi:hypothetical protein